MYTSKARPDYQSSRQLGERIRFAIIGNPRTGSSHLGSLLDSHPHIAFWDNEIFDVGQEFDRSGYDHPSQFLTESVFSVSIRAVGFKLLWDALDRFSDVWTMLEEHHIRLIHTVRDNKLDSFISFQLATINDSFTCWYGPWTTTSFIADYHEALEWFQRTQTRDNQIRKLASQHHLSRLELEYNQLCVRPEIVLEFLSVPRCPLRSNYVKQRSGSQREAIENYEELRSAFDGTTWQRYFTDGGV